MFNTLAETYDDLAEETAMEVLHAHLTNDEVVEEENKIAYRELRFVEQPELFI